MTNQELSERVGLSPSPCLRRLKHLEDSEVITRCVALVDPERLGLGVTGFIRIRLDQQDDRHLAILKKRLGLSLRSWNAIS